MARLKKNVKIDDQAFETAVKDLSTLYDDVENLKTEFNKLFKDLSDALQCEAGDELKKAGNDVVIKPLDNFKLVINQVKETLDLVKGTGYYKSIFNEFNALKDDIT